MPSFSTLLLEVAACSRLAQRSELAGALGLAGRALPLWGFAAVEAGPFFYEPNPDGKFALITGAFEEGALVDLVATSLATRAMRRRRVEAVVLGADMIERSRAEGEPLCVFADAWSWLRAGCLGIVVLDFERVAPMLDDVPAFAVQGEFLAARLKRALERPRDVPPMFVPLPVPLPKESAHGS